MTNEMVKVRFLKAVRYSPYGYAYGAGEIGVIKPDHVEELVKAQAVEVLPVEPAKPENTTSKRSRKAQKAAK